MTETQELNSVAAALDQSVKRRLILWIVRWILGFAAIGAVVWWRPHFAWLWWLGAALAALSLVAMLVAYFIVRRRLAVAQRRIEAATQQIAEYERLLPPDGD